MQTAAGQHDSHTYRRQARRLRSVFRDQPLQLHLSLKQLSDRHDVAHRERHSRGVFAFAARDHSATFADQVARQIRGRVLPYSRRLALLQAGQKLGISRFHANLIIAAVQHRLGEATQPASGARWGWSPKLTPLLFFLVIQSVILLGFWQIALK